MIPIELLGQSEAFQREQARSHVHAFLASYPAAAYTAAEIVAAVNRRREFGGETSELLILAQWGTSEGSSKVWWTTLLEAMVVDGEIAKGVCEDVTRYYNMRRRKP